MALINVCFNLRLKYIYYFDILHTEIPILSLSQVFHRPNQEQFWIEASGQRTSI